MSLNVSTNTAALRAGAYLSKNNALLQRSLDRLASGKKISSPIDDPGSLAVSMKLNAAINRLSGAQNNVQNGISYLEVQDGMLDTVGKILDRMSELKGLASQDPMKSDQDRQATTMSFRTCRYSSTAYRNKHSMASVYLPTTPQKKVALLMKLYLMLPISPKASDHTMTIYTSSEGSGGSKVSVHKSLLLSALTLKMDKSLAGSDAIANSGWAAVSSGQAANKTQMVHLMMKMTG